MFQRRRGNRKFPYLSGYLRHVASNPPDSVREGSENVIAGFAAGAWIMAWIAFGIAAPSLWTAIGMVVGFVVSPVVYAMARAIAKRFKRPRNDEEVRQFEYWKCARQFLALDEQNRLHRWCDPNAAQLLEVAAYHWTRLSSSTKGPFWTSDGLPLHWSALRSGAIEAADTAIEELVVLLSPCLGSPQRERKDDVRGVVDDLFDLSLSEALDGFRELNTSDWTRYAHQSPHIAPVYDLARELVERMQELADEIEARTADIKSGVKLVPTQSAAKAIEVVLDEIRTIREAEAELHENA